MSYSGGMSQLAHDMQEQENESGMDLCEAWHHEQATQHIDRIRQIAETAQPEAAKRFVSPIDTCIHLF